MNSEFIIEFAEYLAKTIGDLSYAEFKELGDYDKLYWIEMSKNSIKHSAMLMEYLNQEYNIMG